MIKSQAIQYRDFNADWYNRWAALLKQDTSPSAVRHNKDWQNAAILQALHERDFLKEDNRAIGFGVGTERVPSALAANGLYVTATDQDFQAGKKAGWDNGQLTHKRDDLNIYGIADPKQFKKRVKFENCDMTDISTKHNDSYDIVWSNCALGHLGSIDAGLTFIERSLDCLQPGGIAVHTTETNVVSNRRTLDSGGTVIFRRRDLTKLFYKLRSKGYHCAPLVLDFGSDAEDQHFSTYPFDQKVCLKLNVSGHLLSQMVLIIRKPLSLKPRRSSALVQKVAEDQQNAVRMQRFKQQNIELQHYLARHRKKTLSAVEPQKRVTSLKLKPGETKEITIKFKNTGATHYYDIHHFFHEGHHLTVSTANPVNRDSKLVADGWYGKNRPEPVLKQIPRSTEWGEIKPGATFSATFKVKAPKKSGSYKEEFCLLQEGLAPIAGSDFTLDVTVG